MAVDLKFKWSVIERAEKISRGSLVACSLPDISRNNREAAETQAIAGGRDRDTGTGGERHRSGQAIDARRRGWLRADAQAIPGGIDLNTGAGGERDVTDQTI